jgi:hypothetical protein
MKKGQDMNMIQNEVKSQLQRGLWKNQNAFICIFTKKCQCGEEWVCFLPWS